MIVGSMPWCWERSHAEHPKVGDHPARRGGKHRVLRRLMLPRWTTANMQVAVSTAATFPSIFAQREVLRMKR